MNIDDTGVFFKVLPKKVMIQKSKSCKGDTKSKQRQAVVDFVITDVSKVSEPVVIWKSNFARCFKSSQNKTKPISVHYFARRFKKKRKVILF